MFKNLTVQEVLFGTNSSKYLDSIRGASPVELGVPNLRTNFSVMNNPFNYSQFYYVYEVGSEDDMETIREVKNYNSYLNYIALPKEELVDSQRT